MMNSFIWISIVLILAGVIGYYVAYFKGKNVFMKQMDLYREGIPTELKNVQGLYQIITSVRYPALSNAWIEDDTSVIVGGKRKHKFYLENDGTIKIKHSYSTQNLYGGIFRSLKQMRIHRDIAALVEANQIMDSIATGLGVNNEYKTREYYKASTGFKILCPSFAAIIIGGILLCVGIMFGMNDEFIQYAKGKCPVDGVDATYEDIFNFYLTEPEWDYFESDQNKCIVEVSGFSSMDNNAWILIQFIFVGVSSSESITSYTPIDIAYMEVNGETCTADEAVNNVEYIVETYIKYMSSNSLSDNVNEDSVVTTDDFGDSNESSYDGSDLYLYLDIDENSNFGGEYTADFMSTETLLHRMYYAVCDEVQRHHNLDDDCLKWRVPYWSMSSTSNEYDLGNGIRKYYEYEWIVPKSKADIDYVYGEAPTSYYTVYVYYNYEEDFVYLSCLYHDQYSECSPMWCYW